MAMTADNDRNLGGGATPVRQRSRSVPRHPQQNIEEEENMGSYNAGAGVGGFESYFSSRSPGGNGRERSGEYRAGG